MTLNGRSWAKLLIAVTAFGFLSLLFPQPAKAQSGPDGGNAPYKYNYQFPLLGKKLAARGLTFPIPFGVGLNYAYATQGVDITGVNVAVNDGKYTDLSKIVKFDHVTSTVKVLNGRLDLWVLPFLNVYGLGTYVLDSDTDVLLSEPFPLRAGASQTGYGGGFGAPVRSFLLTPRVGKRFQIGPSVSLAAWVGAMRQAIEADTEGSISLKDAIGAPAGSFESKVASWYNALPGGQQAGVSQLVGGVTGPAASRDPIIHYKLDKALTDPWNLLIGAEVDLHRRVQMRMEYGFLGRTQLIMGICYRFGGLISLDD